MSLSEMMAKNAAKSSGKKFHRFETITKGSLKDGPKVIRPLNDGDAILFANFHEFVPTKDEPEEFTGKRWPKAMPAVCGYDDAYGHGACYVCDNKISDRYGPIKSVPMTYFLANIREPLIATEGPLTGRPIGYKSAMMEVDGEQYPHLVIVQLPVRAVGPGLMAEWERYGTICGSDWTITRTGEGKETRYSIAPDRPDQDFFRLNASTNEEMDVWKDFYGPILELLQPDLKAELSKLGSQEHYDRWYVPGATVEWAQAKAQEEDVPEPDHKAGQVSDEQRDAVKARLAAAMGK